NPLTTDLPSAINSQLPDLSSPAAGMASKQELYELGYSVMLQMRQEGALFDDPETEEYFQQIGQRLASQSKDGGENFHYVAARSDEVNAFAVTGGWVFVLTGLITATHTESEFAGVLAHETAHITQDHVLREIEEQKQSSMTAL